MTATSKSIQVSTFPSTTQPCCFISSAPKDSQYIHYSAKNVELEKILMGVNEGRWKKLIDAIGKRKGGYNANKKALPCFTPSGTFRIRSDWDMLEYSQIVHLDYDKSKTDLSENDNSDYATRLRDRVTKSPYCYCAFLSPSGLGVKVFIRVNSQFDLHGIAFDQVRKVFDELAGVKSDSSVRNLSRLCYVSSDKGLYYNPKSEVFEITAVRPTTTIPDLTTLATNDNSVFAWLYNLTMKGKYQGDPLNGYTEGKRNNFIYVFACNCNRYGLDKAIAADYVRQIWVHDCDGLTAHECIHAVDSAYKHKHEFSSFRLPKSLQQ